MNNPKRVLVIDDEPSLVKATVRCLRIHGFEAVGTERPEDALVQASQQKFDAIVSDVSMPVMNGFQLREAICRAGSSMVGKFVFVSGGGDTPLLQTCLSTVEYLQKPYKNADLIAAVRKITD